MVPLSGPPPAARRADHFGLIGTIQVTSALGLAYNALQFVPNLYAQLGAASVFTVCQRSYRGTEAVVVHAALAPFPS